MKKTNSWFKKQQSFLEKFLAAWSVQAKEAGLRWFPPGMANGLMAEFLGEAREMGALTLRTPSDLEGVKKVGEELGEFLQQATLHAYEVTCKVKGDTITIVGHVVPKKFTLKISSAKQE